MFQGKVSEPVHLRGTVLFTGLAAAPKLDAQTATVLCVKEKFFAKMPRRFYSSGYLLGFE